MNTTSPDWHAVESHRAPPMHTISADDLAAVPPTEDPVHTFPRERRRARIMRGVLAVSLALGGLLMLALRVRRRTR
jgi:hypothetical protein